MKKNFLLSLFCLLAACQGRDTVVNPHEQKLSNGPTQNFDPKTIQFGSLNYASLQQTLTTAKRSPDILLSRVIVPLEKNIFNLHTLLDPQVRDRNFYNWINLYTESLYELVSFQNSRAANEKLDAFIALSMHECNSNLDNCQLLSAFRMSPNSSRLFVLKATRIGAAIDDCLSNSVGRSCSALVTQKYKLLAYANLLDIAATADKDFLSSYMKHANLLLEMNNSTPIHQLSVALFMTLFQQLDPTPEQCEIAKKFDSWSYSKKNSTRYAEISKKLFSLATACDLYQANGQLSASFWKTMNEQQISNSDPSNPSFYNRFLLIKRTPNDMEAARKLGLGPLVAKVTTRTTKGALNPRFFNEYFYALDRLYNGHILLEDAKQILLGATRDYANLLETFNDYMQLQSFLKMTDSKKFLKNMIDRNENTISSERLFERSVLDSEPLAQEWLTQQNSFSTLFIATKYVLLRQNSAALASGLYEAELQFKNLTQSLKVTVTYPAMQMLAHLISEAQGTVSVRTFWGGFQNKSAITLYQELWGGVQQPWFRFADDAAPVDKFHLLYALDYNLKTNFVLVQKDADSHDNAFLRGHFFNVLLNKFIGKIRSELEKKYNDDFRSKRTANPMVARNQAFCAFELEPQTTTIPPLNMPVEGLANVIYSGQSIKTATNYLQPTLDLIREMKNILTHIHTVVKPRIEYARQLLYVAEANGISEESLKDAKAELEKTEKVMNDALAFFASVFKNQKNCLIRMTLAEQYLQYLTIESERDYLAKVHEEMASLQSVDSKNLLTSIDALNNQDGKYKNSNQVLSNDPAQNFFDFFSSKSAFNYSQHDFLKRLAQRLETGLLGTESSKLREHKRKLKEHFPEALKKPLLLKRQWNIQFPPNVIDSAFLKERSGDIPLVWNEDPEEFIRQGLSAINKTNKPFTTWLVDNNEIENFKSLIESVVYLYAATSPSSTNQVTSEDVFKSMEELVYFVSLTDYDLQIFKDIGLESRAPMKTMGNIFLATTLKAGSAEPEVLSESIHPFTFLYDIVIKVLNINNTIFGAETKEANLMADQPLENAYLFSTALNNVGFKMNFQTHDHLAKKLKDEYTQTTATQMNKIRDLRKTFNDKKDAKYAASVFRFLDNEPVTIEGASAVSHREDLIHPQKYNNILIFVREFNQSTKNVYGTGEILKAMQEN